MIRAARFFSVVVFAATFLFLFVPFVHAQSPSQEPPTANTNQVSLNTNPDVPNTLSTWIQVISMETATMLTCQLAGIAPANTKCLGVNPITGKIGFVENGNGAIGVMGQQIAMLSAPPIRTGDYVQYLSQNFGIAKNTYAQGQGFQSITPLVSLWSRFRDVAYLIFTVVFVVVGLGIMLRLKIDPRTVMTIENQIPKLIMGIILVTLSFPIAGLLIDLMYVMMYLGINILASAGVNPINGTNAISVPVVAQNLHTPPIGFANEVLAKPSFLGIQGTTGGGFLSMAGQASVAIKEIVAGLFAPRDFVTYLNVEGSAFTDIPASCGLNPFCWIGTSIGTTIGALLSQIIGWLASWIAFTIAFLVILFALLVALFRLWFALLYAYILILLDVVLAPFWIMAGLFPGSTLGFGAWLRDLISNLTAFPVAVGMILMGKIFMDQFSYAAKAASEGTFATAPFVPPLIGNPNNWEAFGAIVGLGIILYTPEVVNLVKKVFQAPRFDISPVAKALGTGGEIASAGPGAFWKRATHRDPYTKEFGFLRAALYRRFKAGTPLRKAVEFGFGSAEGFKSGGHNV